MVSTARLVILQQQHPQIAHVVITVTTARKLLLNHLALRGLLGTLQEWTALRLVMSVPPAGTVIPTVPRHPPPNVTQGTTALWDLKIRMERHKMLSIVSVLRELTVQERLPNRSTAPQERTQTLQATLTVPSA